MHCKKRFRGVDVVRPYNGEQHQVMLADGRAVPIERQTCTLTATIMTPWAPVAIRLALAVMPGEDDLLILGSKTLHEKLDIDAMKQLRDMAATSGGGASSTEPAPAEVPAMPPGIIDVRRVAVSMGAMQQVADTEVEAAGEPNGFKDALLDRELDMMVGFDRSEMQQREQASGDAVLGAAQAGIPPDDVVELRRLVLDPYKEAFRRGLTGEPPVQMEPGSVQVRSMAVYACFDADYSLPSKTAVKDKQLELAELVGGQTSVCSTFRPAMPDEKGLFWVALKKVVQPIIWIPAEAKDLQARLVVCAHMGNEHRGTAATLQVLRNCCVWQVMEKSGRRCRGQWRKSSW